MINSFDIASDSKSIEWKSQLVKYILLELPILQFERIHPCGFAMADLNGFFSINNI